MTLREFRGCFLAGLVLLCWLCAGVDRAAAQTDPLGLTVTGDHVGLGGYTCPGAWTPALMQLQNNSATPRSVICQFEVDDPDGDVVLMRTQATLSPGRSQDVWAYAHPQLSTQPETRWRFSVIDRDSGAMLARTVASPSRWITNRVRVIGVSGQLPLGLSELADDVSDSGQAIHRLNFGLATQHEANKYLVDLKPSMLPDRWFGMSMMHAYIWTPEEGGDPAAPAISRDTIKAVHEWVRRGGHLVMILPSAEDWWTQSPLADMLPGVELVSRSEVPMPLWIAGAIVPSMPDGTKPRLEVKQLKIKDDMESRYAVLCKDDRGVPLVVAGRYGFGRVTLIGVDITSPSVTRLKVPKGTRTMWQDVFGWRCDAYRVSDIEEKDKEGLLYSKFRQYPDPPIDGGLIDGTIDMKETVFPLLLGASALFAVYWTLACPGSWWLLRRRGMERHSWGVFTAIACAFVAIAWFGALFTRPTHERVAHFSVVDLDSRSQQARVNSWATVFVPTHGKVRLDVEGEEKAATANGPSGMLWAIGSMNTKEDNTKFLDSQLYEMDGSLPSAVDMPFRGTAKRVQIDWRGPFGALAWPEGAATTAPATMPADSGRGIRGKIIRNGELLRGRLSHDLPGTLNDVRVIYPAADGEPWVARLNSWQPGEPIDLERVTNALNEAGRPARQRLAIRAPNQDEYWSGYLGDLMKYSSGITVDPNNPNRTLDIAASTLAQWGELLTFFDNLPPPRAFSTKPVGLMETEKGFGRGPGRVLEMSQALGLKRVIILGHIDNAPLAVPFHADGKTLPSGGWTMVRWVGEVESGK